MSEGATPRRLLLASTGTKDPKAPAARSVEAPAAPFSINTMPEATLKAFADHGRVGATVPADGSDCDTVRACARAAGIDLDALAAKLPGDGGAAFVGSWQELLGVTAAKSQALT